MSSATSFSPTIPASRLSDHIASTANRLDCVGIKSSIELRSQSAEVGFNDVRLGIEIEVPHPFEQHSPRHHPAGIAHQLGEQGELARLQSDALPGAHHRAPVKIKDNVRDRQSGGLYGGGQAPEAARQAR